MVVERQKHSAATEIERHSADDTYYLLEKLNKVTITGLTLSLRMKRRHIMPPPKKLHILYITPTDILSSIHLLLLDKSS